MGLFEKIFKNNKKEIISLELNLSCDKFTDEEFTDEKLKKFKEKVDVYKIAKIKDDKLWGLETKAHESKNIDEEIQLRKNVIKYYTEYKDEFFKKGGCYKEYFINMHMKCHNSRNPCFEAIEPHIKRLKYIKENYDRLITEEKQQKENDIKKQNLMKSFDNELRKALEDNPNILQTDLYKMFDVLLKPEISERLYDWNKSGVITREKCGRSFKVKLKK
jgi:hypothetical protein